MKAIVVGGGIAGLLAARVLADQCELVTVLEKDGALGSRESRSGAAQGAHLHVLLQRGQELLQDFFPGIDDTFAHHGCPRIDWALDTAWETKGGAYPRYESGLVTRSLSRPLLEATIRATLANREKIVFHQAHVEKVITENGRVMAVQCIDGKVNSGDLFVLAGGQNLPLQKLLPEHSGEITRHTTHSPIHITYRSLRFRTNSLHYGSEKQYYYQFTPPHDRFGAVVCPQENGVSVATIIEYGGHHRRKLSSVEFLELAEKIPGGHLVEILAAGIPLGEVSEYHKPTMYVRALHSVNDFPVNLFAMGDVLCSLNPVFGQGMTLALEQAKLLAALLKKNAPSSLTFHREAARKNKLPYLLSKLGSSTKQDFSTRYLFKFQERCRSDQARHRSFLNVLHLKAGYGALVDPVALFSAVRVHSNG